MSILTAEQQRRALDLLQEYRSAPANPDGRTIEQVQAERDRTRVEVIDSTLLPLLRGYLKGEVPLDQFKSKVDGINKRHTHWGFRGIKGQMFFNMLLNVANRLDELDSELRTALAKPTDETNARSRINTFKSYVRAIGEEYLDGGGTKHGRPKVSSIPFFLSYFWQVQEWPVWPVYYTNTVNTLIDQNLWRPVDDLAEDYIAYKHLHEELAALFEKASGRPFTLYDVEHVFWFKGGNPFGGSTPLKEEELQDVKPPPKPVVAANVPLLPDSFVPPIIAVLPQMARNDPILVEAAKASGTNLDRAFEKHIHAALTMIGYESKLLGQGQGRVPDGVAVDLDDSYAILWDAKIRANGYSMGTDDRTIREYIHTQSRDMKRRRGLRNIYYVIVSSAFADDFDDLIRSLKMDTEVSEVVLMEAEALVAMVEAKLRNPLQLPLGPDGLQRMFSVSGMLTASDVQEAIG